MLAAIEFVGINTEGKVELESDRRDVYSAILFVSASSFFTHKLNDEKVWLWEAAAITSGCLLKETDYKTIEISDW